MSAQLCLAACCHAAAAGASWGHPGCRGNGFASARASMLKSALFSGSSTSRSFFVLIFRLRSRLAGVERLVVGIEKSPTAR